MNLNRICRNGMTHLGAAAQTGNLFILQMLLEHSSNTVSDSDVENCNSTRSGLLHLDVAMGKRQNMGYFVVCKDMEENDLGEGPTPDGMEALEWDMEITEESVKEEEQYCPEINLYKWYAKILNQTSIILQSPDNDIARLDGHGRNILHYAILSGCRDMVDYLLSNYSELSVNQSDSNCYSPLHISVMTGSVRMTEFLLIKNANINSITRDRLTPLHLAAQCGFCDIIYMLLDYGADINSFDINERSPLTLAIAQCKEDAARILIKKGTRLNHEESSVDGYTPLYRAVVNNLTNTVKLLIDYGAKIIHSHFLLHIAASKGNLEIVKILIKAGAVVNMRNEEGMTPLMLACSTKNLHIAKYLLKIGNKMPTMLTGKKNGLLAFNLNFKLRSKSLFVILLFVITIAYLTRTKQHVLIYIKKKLNVVLRNNKHIKIFTNLQNYDAKCKVVHLTHFSAFLRIYVNVL